MVFSRVDEDTDLNSRHTMVLALTKPLHESIYLTLSTEEDVTTAPDELASVTGDKINDLVIDLNGHQPPSHGSNHIEDAACVEVVRAEFDERQRSIRLLEECVVGLVAEVVHNDLDVIF